MVIFLLRRAGFSSLSGHPPLFFALPDGSPSLLAQLERLSSTPSPELKSDILSLCGATVGSALPTSVLGFKPTLRVKTTPLPEEQLLEKCQKWFEVRGYFAGYYDPFVCFKSVSRFSGCIHHDAIHCGSEEP